MNIHVDKTITEKYPGFEFVGKSFSRFDRKLIKAYNHAIGKSYFYSFDEDFFWDTDMQIPEWKIKI